MVNRVAPTLDNTPVTVTGYSFPDHNFKLSEYAMYANTGALSTSSHAILTLTQGREISLGRNSCAAIKVEWMAVVHDTTSPDFGECDSGVSYFNVFTQDASSTKTSTTASRLGAQNVSLDVDMLDGTYDSKIKILCTGTSEEMIWMLRLFVTTYDVGVNSLGLPLAYYQDDTLMAYMDGDVMQF